MSKKKIHLSRSRPKGGVKSKSSTKGNKTVPKRRSYTRAKVTVKETTKLSVVMPTPTAKISGFERFVKALPTLTKLAVQVGQIVSHLRNLF
jgi:hypothetical protein